MPIMVAKDSFYQFFGDLEPRPVGDFEYDLEDDGGLIDSGAAIFELGVQDTQLFFEDHITENSQTEIYTADFEIGVQDPQLFFEDHTTGNSQTEIWIADTEFAVS